MIILRLAAALFLVQAGFHAYTASMPLALARAGTPDAEIGLVMGVSAIVQVPAAVWGGRLIDRFGGQLLFTLGGIAYLLATGILLLPGADPAASLEPFVAARILQGVGIGLALPSALTMVPHLVAPRQVSAALAYVGAAQNLTLVVLPPLSIVVLDAAGLHGVAAMVVAFVLAGIVLGQRMPLADLPHPELETMAVAQRRFGVTFRPEWTLPLLIIMTYVAHWGAVTAYLPVRAENAGANVGLYFAADGIAIAAMRIPTGHLVARFTLRGLILTGASMTAVAIGLLLLPLTTPQLVVSGLLGGAGGALVMTPITIELSRRSTDADRGSAFALFSGALATAIAIGSIGGAPVVAVFGLNAALAVGIGCIFIAMALTVSDRALASRAGGEPPAPAPAPA